MKIRTLKDSKYFYPSLLVLIWAVICAVIDFSGNFPLGDDWAYGKPVLEFVQTGRVHITDWSSMTLVGQIWYGGLITKLFGFSFEVLRISTLFMALSAILASYSIILRLTKNAFYGFIGAALFMISPHFVRYAFSFCTDVPFLGFALWGVYFLLRYIDEEKIYQYALGIAFVAYAFLIRDVAIVIPPAFALAYGLKHTFRINKLPAMITINILIAVEYFAYRYWLTHIHGMTGSMDYSKNILYNIWTSGPLNIAKRYGKNFYYFITYIGSCLFPIIFLMIGNTLKNSGKYFKRSFWITSLFGSFGSIFVLVRYGAWAIYYREFLFDLFYSHFILFNVHSVSSDMIWIPPIALIIILTLIAINSGIALLWIFIKAFSDYRKKINQPSLGKVVFLSAISFFYLTIILSQNIFNRYLMIVLPVIVGALLYLNKVEVKAKFNRALLFLMTALIFFFSVVLTRDLLTYERAKWHGLDYLTKELKISPKQIDGGFEFNGWNLYDFHYKKTKTKNWWWVEDDKYIVTHGLIPGYKIIKSFDYTLWLPPGCRTKAVVLERETERVP